MYAMGEKYIVPGLKALAQARFKTSHLTLDAHSVAKVVAEVYSTTVPEDRGLREFILYHCLVGVGHYTKVDEFNDVVRDVPRFGYELLIRAVEKVERLKPQCHIASDCYHCRKSDAWPLLYCKHNQLAEQSPKIL